MKLLFDQNLSPSLVAWLGDLFPASMHVSQAALDKAVDVEVWNYARDNGFTIVTRDADFGEMSIVHHSPPKVIWLRHGNCSSRDIEGLLRTQSASIVAFQSDPRESVLAIF